MDGYRLCVGKLDTQYKRFESQHQFRVYITCSAILNSNRWKNSHNAVGLEGKYTFRNQAVVNKQ